MKKLISIVMIAGFAQIGFANKCPSLDAIKHNHLSGWKAYDTQDGTPLTNEQFTQFKNKVTQFALAEWNDKKNVIHCYYHDKNGADLEAYLAKGKYVPDNGKNFWYQVSGAMQCAAGVEKCEFKLPDFKKKHLAKRL